MLKNMAVWGKKVEKVKLLIENRRSDINPWVTREVIALESIIKQFNIQL